MTPTATNWRRATKSDPCIFCGWDHYCGTLENGNIARCMRPEKAQTPAGWSLTKTSDDGGLTFRRDSGTPPRPKINGQASTPESKQIFETVDAAIKTILTWSDFRGSKPTTHQYPDEFAILRFDFADGSKRVFPIHHTSGAWPLTDPPGLLPLYRRNEIQAADADGAIVITEGEKCADFAAGLGFVATTSSHGSNSAHQTDWTPLAGRDVVIMPDNNAAGERYATDVGNILTTLTPLVKVRILRLPGLPDGGDVVDWVGGLRPEADAADLLGELIETKAVAFGPTPEAKPRAIIRKLTDVPDLTTEWLWDGRLPLGTVSFLMGRPGLGKSLFSIDLAARITTGRAFPNAAETREPSGVLICTAEDDVSRTVKPRLRAAGADLSRVLTLDGIKYRDDSDDVDQPDLGGAGDLGRIEDALAEFGRVSLIIVDPLSAFLGGIDAHRDTEVRSALGRLSRMAERLEVTILGIAHLRKSESSSSLDRMLGSVAFGAHARSVFMLGTEGGEGGDDGRVIYTSVKSNLAVRPKSLAFRIQAKDGVPFIEWENTANDIRPDELLVADKTRGSKVAEQAAWLTERLKDGPVLGATMLSEGRTLFPSGTLDRAKSQAGVSAINQRVGPDGPKKPHWYIDSNTNEVVVVLRGASQQQRYLCSRDNAGADTDTPAKSDGMLGLTQEPWDNDPKRGKR